MFKEQRPIQLLKWYVPYMQRELALFLFHYYYQLYYHCRSQKRSRNAVGIGDTVVVNLFVTVTFDSFSETFTLGDPCRLRQTDSEEGMEEPLQYDVPPDTPYMYAVLVNKTLDRTNDTKTLTLTSLANYRSETCSDLPTGCIDIRKDEVYRRSLKQKLLAMKK